jgi:hypothetical protein
MDVFGSHVEEEEEQQQQQQGEIHLDLDYFHVAITKTIRNCFVGVEIMIFCVKEGHMP